MIVAYTFRYFGHSKSDNRVYRSTEIEDWHRMYDPIITFAACLQGKNILRTAPILRCDRIVSKAMTKAVEFAMDSPYPSPTDLHENVYVK